MSKDKELKVLSLFSGCGGLDLGFEGNFNVLKSHINLENTNDEIWVKLPKTRFTTVFCNDILHDAKTAWTNFFCKEFGFDSSVYVCDSIVNLVKKHKNGEKIFPEDIDVLTGGFPCQDFSVSGKRNGLFSHKSHNDTIIDSENVTIENRGQLYIWMKEVIEITQPNIFIGENVKGLTNLSDVKSIIENDFKSIGDDGYLVFSRLLHFADYGIPQSRERVVFIGIKKSALNNKAFTELSKDIVCAKYDPYPKKTHSLSLDDNGLLPTPTLRETFVGLEEPEKSNDMSQQKFSRAKYMGKHCQGQTEVNLDSIGPTIRAEHHGNIEFRRLSKEHGGKNNNEIENGFSERRLTIRECSRIQTFPDNYDFIISKNNDSKGLSSSSSYKLIGNSVPPLFAYHLSRRLEDNWDLYFGCEKFE
ncbi:MAG: DNA cytosine methyltransferase [Oscillospiraceae bacterium]|nr:DNA cytosine methyltransferase [Oscillospiraceae bacterium]